MKSFAEMGLPANLLTNLEALNFSEPTPIQYQSIPLALAGKDVLGSAHTGTGKTGAFGIPLVALLQMNARKSAIVLTPTRELATQVCKQLCDIMGRQSKLKTALLIGGESMGKQCQQIRKQPRVIVGTPGRINDHLQRQTLKLDKTDFLVLDETDRMLDLGFTPQIERVMKHLPLNRQTLLFSATLPKNTSAIAKQYLNHPVRVAVDPASTPTPNLDQKTIRIKESNKYSKLFTEIEGREGSIIVFVKTKHAAERMAKRLSEAGLSASAIHGDLRQNKRDRVIAAFRKKKFRILVATDVAARGLDIPHIEHVINYDLPQCPEDYIHRIGRTARAGAKGSALNLVSPGDRRMWDDIERLLDPNYVPSHSLSKSKDRSQRGKKSAPKSKRFKAKKSFSDRPKSRDFKSEDSFSDRPKFKGSQSKKSFSDRRSGKGTNTESKKRTKPKGKGAKASHLDKLLNPGRKKGISGPKRQKPRRPKHKSSQGGAQMHQKRKSHSTDRRAAQ